MSPRLSACLAQTYCRQQLSTVTSFLAPFAYCQNRSASILSSLSDTPGSYSKKIRRGRGPASGKGKTSGRGQKGQKARGKVPKQFNGGQTPEAITHGKFGFKNVHKVEMEEVNLSQIVQWVEQKRLDPTKPITVYHLYKSGILNSVSDGVKLLARGKETFKTPINIVVSRASEDAVRAVEAAGGSVTTRYYTEKAIRAIKRGEMHPFVSLRWDPQEIGKEALIPSDGEGMDIAQRATGLGYRFRLPDPASRKDIEYYRDTKHRGYLSHLVAQGQSPSLFWKPPISDEELAKLRKSSRRTGTSRQIEENKLW